MEISETSKQTLCKLQTRRPETMASESEWFEFLPCTYLETVKQKKTSPNLWTKLKLLVPTYNKNLQKNEFQQK